MTIVDLYWFLVLRALNSIQKEVSNVGKGNALEIAVQTINDPVRSDGLVPALIVLGALSCRGLLISSLTSFNFKRTVAMRKASTAMSKPLASRQLNDAPRTWNESDLIVCISGGGL